MKNRDVDLVIKNETDMSNLLKFLYYNLYLKNRNRFQLIQDEDNIEK